MTTIKSLKDQLLESAVADQLEKQQNKRFYDYNQCQVPIKFQIAFSIGIHYQHLPPELVNYCPLAGYLLKEQFCKNMKKHMTEHCKHFKSWEIVDYKKAKDYQVLGCQ